MALEIRFGKVAIERDDDKPYLICDWPDFAKEIDGTSDEYTESSGWNYRDIYYSRVEHWEDSVDEVKKFFKATDNGAGKFFLNENMMSLIGAIPETNEPIFADHAKWLKYWAKRAKEEFGDDAIIAFS